MTPTTFTAGVTPSQAALLRRVLALTEQLDDLALHPPEGTVFDVCENAVLTGGRDVQRQLLQNTLARRIEAAEKRGVAANVCLRSGQGESRPQDSAGGECVGDDTDPATLLAVSLRHDDRRVRGR